MLEEPRQLDFGITDIVYDWAQGESLSQVLYGTDLTAAISCVTANGLPTCFSR